MKIRNWFPLLLLAALVIVVSTFSMTSAQEVNCPAPGCMGVCFCSNSKHAIVTDGTGSGGGPLFTISGPDTESLKGGCCDSAAGCTSKQDCCTKLEGTLLVTCHDDEVIGAEVKVSSTSNGEEETCSNLPSPPSPYQNNSNFIGIPLGETNPDGPRLVKCPCDTIASITFEFWTEWPIPSSGAPTHSYKKEYRCANCDGQS